MINLIKDKFFDFLKGIIVGIGNILPGFSGGVMAVSFNVYDKIIHALTHFFKTPFKVIKDIWALAFGIGLGIVISLFGIKLLLDNFPIPTIFFFTGLIVGSIPNIYDKTKSDDLEVKKLIAFLLGLGLVIGFLIFSIVYKESSTGVVIGVVDLKQIIILFFVGIIAAATMIIPGVSGSLVLLAIGYYNYILEFATEFLKALLMFDFEVVFNNFLLVVAFGLGIVVGILSLAKLVEKLIDKYPKIFYSAVLGLLIASPFAIIYQMYMEYKEVIQDALIFNWIFVILFLIVGVFASIYITKSEERTNQKKFKEELK